MNCNTTHYRANSSSVPGDPTGVASDLRPELSIALGTSEVTLLELTGAFSALAAGGVEARPHGVLEIRDRGGTVLWRRRPPEPARVVEKATLAYMNDMLRSVIAWGTGRSAALPRPAAGKTGTTQDHRDAWFVGYTADLVAGVWVGNDDGRPMNGVTGGAVPAKIWKDVMTAAHRGVAERQLVGGVGGPAPTVYGGYGAAPGAYGKPPPTARAPARAVPSQPSYPTDGPDPGRNN